MRPTREAFIAELKRAAYPLAGTSHYLAFLHVEIAAFHPDFLVYQKSDSSLWLCTCAYAQVRPRRILTIHSWNDPFTAILAKAGVTRYDAL